MSQSSYPLSTVVTVNSPPSLCCWSLRQDINNDGASDILVGAYKADPAGSMSGAAYIVFGSTAWSAGTIDLGDLGAGGLTLDGGDRREYAGYSVAGAGGMYPWERKNKRVFQRTARFVGLVLAGDKYSS